jgi:N-acetylneuraminic acid mutarotase
MVGGNLYVVGGYGATASNPLESVSGYSPAIGSWSPAQPYPVKAWGQACAAIATTLYCFGGQGAGRSAYKLGVASGHWSRLGDMPPGYNNSEGHTAVADPELDEVFIMGSFNSAVSNQTWAYLASNDTFVRKHDMLIPNAWFTAALYQNKIYAIGGANALPANHGNVFVYDIPTDSWYDSFARLPGPDRYGAIRNPGEFNGLIPVVDGHLGKSFYNLTDFYDVARNCFLSGPSTTRARDGVSGGIVGNVLYVVGGRNSTAPNAGLTLAEELDLDSYLAGCGHPK